MNDITIPTPTPTPQPLGPGDPGRSQRRKRITVAGTVAVATALISLVAWLFPDPLEKLDQKEPAPGAPSVPTPQEQAPDPTTWPPEPDFRPTPPPGGTNAQGPKPGPSVRQPVYAGSQGTNGQDGKPARGRARFSPDETETAPPVESIEEPPGQETLTILPSPQEPEVEAPSDPEVTVGDQIDVVAEALEEPQGPRPLTPLRYPPVPADALRSRLSSEQMVCVVTVEPDGVASADCDGNPPDLPRFLLQQAKRILEEAQWQPATDENGEPRPGRVAVRFTWR